MGDNTGRRDAYGTVGKGNGLDGARFILENFEPFGRGMRGASNVYVTKDRPGYLRENGLPTETPGKTRMGVLVVDDISIRSSRSRSSCSRPRTMTSGPRWSTR